MTCRELVEFLDEYLAGDLAADVRSRFDAHLAECRDCVVYLRSYRDGIQLLRETAGSLATEVPANVPPELLSAIRAARRRGP